MTTCLTAGPPTYYREIFRLGRFLTSVDYFNKAQASVESFDFAKVAKMDQAVKDAFKKVKRVFGLGKNQTKS